MQYNLQYLYSPLSVYLLFKILYIPNQRLEHYNSTAPGRHLHDEQHCSTAAPWHMTRTLHSHFPGVKSIKIIMKIRPLIVWKFCSFPSAQNCSTAAKAYRWQRNFVVMFKSSAVFLLLVLSHYYKQVLKHCLSMSLHLKLECLSTKIFTNEIAHWWLLCWQASQYQV